MAALESKFTLLSGDIYVARYSGTTLGGSVGPMIADVIEQQPASEVVNVTSKGRASYGQVANSVNLPAEPTGQIVFKNTPAELLASAWFGEALALSESGAVVTGEAHAGCVHDKWYELANRNIGTGTFTLTDDPDTAPGWVEGTDYEVNYRLGMFRTLSTGSAADAAAVLADYTSYAVTGTTITLNTQSVIKVKLRLDGKNLADNSEIEWVAYSASLSPSEPIDLMAGEHVNCAFNVTYETPSGQTSPTKLELVTRAIA